MSTESALIETGGEVYMPALDGRQVQSRMRALASFVSEAMREGIDYGVIPGTGTKRVLLKAGAEKLTTLFGLSVRFDLVERIEDWTGEQHGGEPFFAYWFRAALWRGDLLIAEADGSCNSWESRYRWRKAELLCPECGVAAIIAGKAEYGGGWLCWRKRGGCGVKFDDDDQRITSQPQGKVPNPDPADVVNTVLKMAQKRALVAAVLLAVNASDYFTQDLDDLPVDGSFSYVGSESGDQDRDAGPRVGRPEAASGSGQAKGRQERKYEHWIDQAAPRYEFWHTAQNELNLSVEQTHAILGVEHVNEFKGSLEDALAKLREARGLIDTERDANPENKDLTD